MIELVKHIQHCKSMRHLAIVDCGITDTGARSLEREFVSCACMHTCPLTTIYRKTGLIMLNSGIEVIRLDENHISRSCVELMVKACALHGVRSSFRQLCVRVQRPPLTAADLEAIDRVAQKVGVKCHLSEALRDEVDELRSSFSAMRERGNESLEAPPCLSPSSNRSANASIAEDYAPGSSTRGSHVSAAGNSDMVMQSGSSPPSPSPSSVLLGTQLQPGVPEGAREEDDDAKELEDLRTRLEAKFTEMRRGGKAGSLYKHVYL